MKKSSPPIIVLDSDNDDEENLQSKQQRSKIFTDELKKELHEDMLRTIDETVAELDAMDMQSIEKPNLNITSDTITITKVFNKDTADNLLVKNNNTANNKNNKDENKNLSPKIKRKKNKTLKKKLDNIPKMNYILSPVIPSNQLNIFKILQSKIGQRVFGTKIIENTLKINGIRQWFENMCKWHDGELIEVNCLVLKNIPKKITEKELFEIFSQAGMIRRIIFKRITEKDISNSRFLKKFAVDKMITLPHKGEAIIQFMFPETVNVAMRVFKELKLYQQKVYIHPLRYQKEFGRGRRVRIRVSNHPPMDLFELEYVTLAAWDDILYLKLQKDKFKDSELLVYIEFGDIQVAKNFADEFYYINEEKEYMINRINEICYYNQDALWNITYKSEPIYNKNHRNRQSNNGYNNQIINNNLDDKNVNNDNDQIDNENVKDDNDGNNINNILQNDDNLYYDPLEYYGGYDIPRFEKSYIDEYNMQRVSDSSGGDDESSDDHSNDNSSSLSNIESEINTNNNGHHQIMNYFSINNNNNNNLSIPLDNNGNNTFSNYYQDNPHLLYVQNNDGNGNRNLPIHYESQINPYHFANPTKKIHKEVEESNGVDNQQTHIQNPYLNATSATAINNTNNVLDNIKSSSFRNYYPNLSVQPTHDLAYKQPIELEHTYLQYRTTQESLNIMNIDPFKANYNNYSQQQQLLNHYYTPQPILDQNPQQFVLHQNVYNVPIYSQASFLQPESWNHNQNFLHEVEDANKNSKEKKTCYKNKSIKKIIRKSIYKVKENSLSNIDNTEPKKNFPEPSSNTSEETSNHSLKNIINSSPITNKPPSTTAIATPTINTNPTKKIPKLLIERLLNGENISKSSEEPNNSNKTSEQSTKPKPKSLLDEVKSLIDSLV